MAALGGAATQCSDEATDVRLSLAAELLFSERGRLILRLCFCANPFRVRFSFIRRLIGTLANFCGRLVFVRWLYIDNKALTIG